MNNFPISSLDPFNRLLVVDDDPVICAMIKSLTAAQGYQVTVVNTALEMAHYMEREAVDCIFLDIDLPDGDGVELLARLRQHSQVPVIMITGSQSKELRLEALELGADDYVMKPVDGRELLARLRNILRRVYRTPSPNMAMEVQNPSLGIAHR